MQEQPRAIKLAHLTFPSREEARQYLRALLIRGRYPAPLASTEQAVVEAALTHHPQARWLLSGAIDRIEVRINDPYRTPGLWIVYAGGRSQPFSLKSLFRSAQKSYHERVMGALRHEIEPQIRAFVAARQWPAICPLSGVVVASPYQAHVDHAYPMTFSALAKGWLKKQGLTTSQIAVKQSPDHAVARVLSSAVLASSWLCYHAQHATLRIVAAAANINAGDRAPEVSHAR